MRLTDSRLRRIASVSLVLMIAGLTTGLLLDLTTRSGTDSLFAVYMSLFPLTGFLVILRRPRERLGWVMFSMGYALVLPLEPYARYALVARQGDAPLGSLALALSGPTWIPLIAVIGFLLLLFPDGRLPSPRWRWLPRTAVVGLSLLGLLILFGPANGADMGFPDVANPLHISWLDPLLGPAITLALAAPLLIFGGAAALVVRLRRTEDAVERHQIRWLASAGVIVAVLYGIAFAGAGTWDSWIQQVAVASFALIPIAIGIAVLRYRLYDIDIVIKKAVVFTVLAVFITVVYVAVVIGVGALVGTSTSPVLSAAAAAVVALVFQPVRVRARRMADRLVYGKRATPYETLARLGDQLAGSYASDDVLPKISRVLVEGMGAIQARVFLDVGDAVREVARWPLEHPDTEGEQTTVEVLHHGEALGSLTVIMPANDPLDPARRQLLDDFAAQAGMVLRNVRLTEDLRARLDDLAAAQRRLVTAQDEERRRLERNLHDGAQQQLVALGLKARLAKQAVAGNTTQAAELLSQIESEAGAALEDLRDLARGIYPPVLADRGLLVALETHARRFDIAVHMDGDGIGRLPQEVEAAIYFSVLEALQNVSKYAEASSVSISFEQQNGEVAFTVSDDGRGFDPTQTGYGTGLQGVADRLGALGGTVAVVSAPGSGTTISGTVPVG